MTEQEAFEIIDLMCGSDKNLAERVKRFWVRWKGLHPGQAYNFIVERLKSPDPLVRDSDELSFKRIGFGCGS